MPSDDLRCQRKQCPSLVPARATTRETDDAARAAGWSIWRGRSIGGQEQTTVVCDRCQGSKRSKPSPEPYDVPLF